MQSVKIDRELALKVPGLQLSCIECDVEFLEQNADLWAKMLEKITALHDTLKVEEISQIPAIAAARQAYKNCGKSPARYRVSSEALLRRIVKRDELYQVNNVVDCLNLVSISTGFSIGGYDAAKVQGDAVFGIGRKDEPYVGIGRGELNIEGMPVFRDEKGAFGTPTSDSVRTSVTAETTRFLMVIVGFGATGELLAARVLAEQLLSEFAGASNFETATVAAE